MKQLESAVQSAGLDSARSILATGNFVVRSKLSAPNIAAIFDAAMRQQGLQRPIVMRDAAQLEALAACAIANPALLERPSKVLVHFFQAPVAADAVAKIMTKATFERASMLGNELLIDFQDQISASKLTLEFIERSAGSVGTARNWNTVQKLLTAARLI